MEICEENFVGNATTKIRLRRLCVLPSTRARVDTFQQLMLVYIL